MACDSLVTGDYPSQSNKIFRRADCLIGYAGDWLAGYHLVDSYLSNREPIRGDNDDVDILILRKTGIYCLDPQFREVRVTGKYYAIGSGSQAAMVAMNMGADAVGAIREAIKVDQWTGGRVRSLRLETK